jgi:hypothetical protein
MRRREPIFHHLGARAIAIDLEREQALCCFIEGDAVLLQIGGVRLREAKELLECRGGFRDLLPA